MRLDIYGLFVVRVIVPQGRGSKGRPTVAIEEGDVCRPCDRLIPNGLSSSELERYVAEQFAAFARPGRRVRRIDRERLAA